MTSLTTAKVRGLTKAGRYGDGGGLYLTIAPGGSKAWVMRLTVGGKRTDKGLGGYPKVSLTEARQKADAYRVAVSEGRNPWMEVKREREQMAQAVIRMPTFAEAANKVHTLKVEGGQIGNTKSANNWINGFKRHVFPDFGHTRVNEISKGDVMEVLDPLGAKLPETARRLRQRMREVFDYCMEHNYITVNPAGEGIRASVKRWSGHRKVTHFKALPYQDVPGIMDKILHSQGLRETRLALGFQALTAARSGEVRGATWDEIDLEAATWTIPTARMKAKAEHRVPLSIEAMMLLRDAREAPGHLVFAHQGDQPLSDSALSLRTRKDGLGCTPHGFRSSFKDWATAQGKWQWEAIELCLAHKVGNSVAQAYFRDDLLEQRRPIMDEWSQYVWPVRPF